MKINKVKFSGELYDLFSVNKNAVTLKEKIFDLNNTLNRSEYMEITESFKKWIYWISPYELDGTRYNRVYFDANSMRTEYSILLGNQVSPLELKESTDKKVKSIEEVISESLKRIEKSIDVEHDKNDKFTKFFDYLNTWNQTFVVNCIPNISYGNYVNIPMEYVEIDEYDCEMIEFEDSQQYFNNFLNRLPIELRKIKIGENVMLNIINKTLIPLFITTEKVYIVTKDQI
jgi:hypothetical protein